MHIDSHDLLAHHSETDPSMSWEKTREQKPRAINARKLLLGFYSVCLSVFLYSRGAHTSQAFPMCETATRLSADRLAVESPV